MARSTPPRRGTRSRTRKVGTARQPVGRARAATAAASSTGSRLPGPRARALQILPCCVFAGQGTGLYEGSYYSFTYKQGTPIANGGVAGEGSRAHPVYFTTYRGKYYWDGSELLQRGRHRPLRHRQRRHLRPAGLHRESLQLRERGGGAMVGFEQYRRM